MRAHRAAMLPPMPRSGSKDSPRRELLAVLLAALGASLLAFAVIAPALRGGYLSDDLQFNYFLSPREAEPRLDPTAVLADFARPWLGIEGGATYRPIISLQYALDVALGGADPRFALHLSNAIAHALSSALVAVLAALLVARAPVQAACIAGALFAVHPSCVETSAWIAGRVSGTQALFSLLACTAFAAHVRTTHGIWWAASAASAILALGSKESAVVLPVAFLAIELLCGGRATARARFARHVGFLPLWIGYFALRAVVLGSLVGEGLEATGDMGSLALLANALDKARAVFAPWPEAIDAARTALWPLALWIPVLLACALGSRGRRAFGVLLFWTAALFAPAWSFGVGLDEGGLRLVYEAASVCALLAAIGVAELRSAPIVRGAAWVSILGLGACFACSTREKLAGFEKGWARVDAAIAAVEQRAPETSFERPIVLVATSVRERGVPLWNANGLFPIAQKPLASRDLPCLSLGCVFENVLHSESFFGDAAPLRAVVETGTPLLLPADLGFTELRREPAVEAALPLEVALGAGASRFVFADCLRTPAIAPTWIEGLRVRVTGAPRGGVLRWISPIPGAELAAFRERLGGEADPVALRFGGGAPDGAETLFEIDLSHSLFFFAHELAAGGILGFELAFEPALESSAIGAVQLLRRVPELERPTPLRGSRVALGSEELVLRAPEGVAFPAALDLVLLCPHAALRVPVGADGRVRFPEIVARDLRRIARVSRSMHCAFYFEERSRDGSARFSRRSRLDWLEIAVN